MTREEAIKGLERLQSEFSGYKPNEEMFNMAIEALSADTVSREFYEDAVKANIGLVIENRQLKEQIESADAVPQLRQTDTLIIADALRYLAKDTERHLVDRTRADALRQQFLKYGASMCKGGAE